MNFDRIDMEALEKELIALRREFHTCPEAGWTEFCTTARIIEELEKLGIPVQYGPEIHVREKMYGLPDDAALEACYARALEETDRKDLVEKMRGGYTGCLAVIEGELPGPTVGIRVDIDCNEVDESSSDLHKPAAEGFASSHKGLMHACGHDAHTAIGIGTAKILSAYRDKLRGKVLLVFQPGEEGLRGAASLTAAGHFSKCDYFLSAHVGILKNQEVGNIAVSAHGFLSSTKLDAVFHGVPAHAATPDEGKNALAAAATAALNLLAIPRHQQGPSRINVGTLHAGSGRNVIPEWASMSLETRGKNGEINAFMEESARRILTAAAAMYDCTCDIRFMGSAGSIDCDPALAHKVKKILAGVDGVKKILEDVDFNGGEDVTTMMRDVQEHGGQATEMVIGMPLTAPHHNGFFDVSEEVIGLGARIFASIALEIEET